MMKRYLPVIFTIFAIIFTHGHAVAADVLPNTPDLKGCTVTACGNTSSYQEEANCAKTTCKRYTDDQGRYSEFTSCEECNEGYTQTQKTASCGGMSIFGLFKCDAEYINCTGKCNSCGPTTTTINTYYTKTINRSCEQRGTDCKCVEGDTTYSCSTNALRTANSVNCNGSNCSGCSKCPTYATCDGSTKFKCNSGYYESDGSCKACPTNSATCNSNAFTCKIDTYKTDTECKDCPTGATCNGTTTFTCNDGYYKSGNACASCPANSTCTSATDFTCNDGHYKSGNGCKACPTNSATCNSNGFTCKSTYYKSGDSCKSCGSITIGDQTITATSDVGATSKSDCAFTNVNTDISEVKFYPNKEDTLNYHEATIKIKSCY